MKIKPRYKFHAVALFFFLPGAGLIVFCGFIMHRNLLPILTWTRTTGQITGFEERLMEDDVDYYIFEKATFTDLHGNKNEVFALSSAGAVGANLPAVGEVTIFYDANNPAKAQIFFWRDYLPLVVLPFGVLLAYLGWPIEKQR